ncbi:MAG TPA: hypothetical protein VII05_01215 [Gaiellaceae bacterium]|jgi:uncharacterized spore protein YtfJ
MPTQPRNEDKSHERKRVARAALDQASAKRVYGEPIEIEGGKIIPVAAVRRCGQQEDAEAGEKGCGCGCSCVSVRPVGLVVIRGGQVEWQPIFDYNRAALAVAGVFGLVLLFRRRR